MDIGVAGRVSGNDQLIGSGAVVSEHCLDFQGAAIADIIAGNSQRADLIAGRNHTACEVGGASNLANALKPPASDLHRAAKNTVDRKDAVLDL
jgi:hypothetical protein